MKPLRVGCVGTGFIANAHLGALSGFSDVEIVAVADAVPDRAAETATRYGARAYDDGVRLLQSEELDAVWLCVPPFAHGPLEVAALDRHLPFFVEKPIALDLRTALDIADLVRQRAVRTAVGYHWRHLDVVDTVARLVRDVPPQLVLGYWLDKTPSVPWWAQRARSGGQVVEQSTHIFDLARVLAGEVDTVRAVERTTAREAFAGADVPTVSAATLLFASGAIGTLASTCVLPSRHRVGLHLIADGFVAELTEASLSDHELRLVTAEADRLQRSEQNPIEREDREFVDVLLGRREEVRVPYDEALRTHVVACAADRSARDGVPVDLSGEVPGA
ncbi:MAG: Gfo/Idh/MocA family oxidoreductase [Actinomycetota bacterium]|nr:Gfo/Idh/MocA family oxidoreductase [Actinomycetota bacterium]